MVATAARIAFVTQEFRTVVSKNDTVHTNYGKVARDTKQDIVETFFEDRADAQAIDDERLSLLSPDRRRFRHEVNDVLSFTGTLDYSQATPAATVIDDERSANHAAAIVELGIKFEDDKTTLTTWG